MCGPQPPAALGVCPGLQGLLHFLFTFAYLDLRSILWTGLFAQFSEFLETHTDIYIYLRTLVRYEFMFISLNFSGVVYSLLYDLTFIRPCLVIFFLQKIQPDAPVYQIYFILEWRRSTCFGRSFCTSSRVPRLYVQLSNRFCCLLASGYPLAGREQYLFDKCLLLYVQSWSRDDGRKDSPKHVEFHSKLKYIWYIGASSWFYYRNLLYEYLQELRCHHMDLYTFTNTLIPLIPWSFLQPLHPTNESTQKNTIHNNY